MQVSKYVYSPAPQPCRLGSVFEYLLVQRSTCWKYRRSRRQKKKTSFTSDHSRHASARYQTSRIVSCSLLTPNMYYPKNVLEPTRILLSRPVEFRILRLIPKSANTPQARGEGNDPLARRAQSGQSSTNPQRFFLCTLLNGGNSTAKRKTDERRKSLM